MAEAAQDWQEEGKDDRDAQLLRERLALMVARLEKEAEDRVSKKDLVEKRWLDDLRQFHGKYDDKTLTELTNNKKSTLFINQTRPKTNAMEARLSDMLFPTDDRNWGIQPTPVPELTVEAEEAAKEAAGLKRQAAGMEEGEPNAEAVQQQANEAEQKSREIQARMDEARKRARSMEEEIEDRLRECEYPQQAREVIRDACQLGTGIMKGPIIGGRSRRSWQEQTDEETGRTAHVMAQVQDQRPVYWRVDPWSYFPDFDARSMDDNESVFERHLMNPKELRKLAREPGFDADAIRRVLRDKPQSTTPTYVTDLRSITGAYQDVTVDRYHVWEYHGPLTAEEMRDLATAFEKPEMTEDLGLDGEDIDPLIEVQAVIWFCQGEVLKFGIHHLDSGDPIYSVFNLEQDEASIFGFGVPYIMRDAQKALSAAWRTMMDNAGLSSGPQIVVNKEAVEPANGVWGLEPRKIWLRKAGAAPNAIAFESYDVPMHQAELANIIELSRRNIDEETSMPMIAQGEQGSHTTETAHGMSLLMNATNVVFRRIVKNFDDDMTTPNIRRLYDWLMQFSDKEHIKGDFEVDARGTSVLLVREMQSANLMAFLMQFGAHPSLSQFLKDGGLPALRRLVQTMMIPADEVIKTDEELAEEAAAQAEAPPEPQPEIMKLEAEMNKAQMESQTKLELAQIERETAMMRLAAEHNMKLDELRARLAEGESKRQSDERKFAAEAALSEREGASGGGWF